MRYRLRDDSSLRLLRLHLRWLRETLYIRVGGPFAQKGHRSAEAVFEAVRQTAQRDVEKFRWKTIPRAAVAVEMMFFSEHAAIPALHNLVKGYLDPLRGIVFRDDRQVACLTALSWKPPADHSDKTRADQNHVYIKVERLRDHVRLFDACRALHDNSEFRSASRLPREQEDEQERSHWHENNDLEVHRLDNFDVPEEAREHWRRMKVIQFQNRVLAANQIGWMDRPGGAPRHLAPIAFFWKPQAHTLLFSLELRGLPARGESKDFRAHVREQVRAVRERWGEQMRFIVPVEADIQVPEEPGVELTDLDNVVRNYIAPALAGELLKEPDGSLHGYRIYRVRRPQDDRTVTVRLLPQGAIQRFGERLDKMAEAGREWLDLRRRY